MKPGMQSCLLLPQLTIFLFVMATVATGFAINSSSDFRLIRNCRACVTAGFGWSLRQERCGHFAAQDSDSCAAGRTLAAGSASQQPLNTDADEPADATAAVPKAVRGRTCPFIVSSQQPQAQSSSQWTYLDDAGAQYGPFTVVQLSKWFRAGQLTLERKLRRAGDTGEFVSLQSIPELMSQIQPHQSVVHTDIELATARMQFWNEWDYGWGNSYANDLLSFCSDQQIASSLSTNENLLRETKQSWIRCGRAPRNAAVDSVHHDRRGIAPGMAQIRFASPSYGLQEYCEASGLWIEMPKIDVLSKPLPGWFGQFTPMFARCQPNWTQAATPAAPQFGYSWGRRLAAGTKLSTKAHRLRLLVDGPDGEGTPTSACPETDSTTTSREGQIHVLKRPTIFVDRLNYENIFHHANAWFSVWSAIQIRGLGWSPDQYDIVLVDETRFACQQQPCPNRWFKPDQPWKISNEVWPIFGRVLNLADLNDRTMCFENAVFATQGFSSGLLSLTHQWDDKGLRRADVFPACTPSTMYSDFAKFMVDGLSRRAGLILPKLQHDHAHSRRLHSCGMCPANLSTLNIALVGRKPTGSSSPEQGLRRSRMIVNEADLVAGLNAARGLDSPTWRGLKPNVTLVAFETMTLTESAHMLSKMDVLIGMHGAGLTNLLFLPKTAIVVELFNMDTPFNMQHVTDYRNLCRLIGLGYANWTNSNPANNHPAYVTPGTSADSEIVKVPAKFASTSVDVDELARVMWETLEAHATTETACQ
jgi:hypothetical protein